MRIRSLGSTCAIVLLAAAGLVLSACSDSKKPAPAETPGEQAPATEHLGVTAAAEPTGSLPWALTPVFAEGDTVVSVNNLTDVASPGMWEMGAGITAISLRTGDRLWHIDYTDEAFGVDTASLPTEATADVVSNKDGKLAVVFASMTCPEDECTGEETEDFALATIDISNGSIISSTKGVGAFPAIVAFAGDTVVYAPDWESAIAVKADAVGGEPVWTSPTFDIYSDAVIDGAVFTAVAEDVPDALGWVNIEDGTAAPYKLDLDAYQSFHIIGPDQAVVTWGDGDDHVVEMINPTTEEIAWQAPVAAGEEENETLQVTATRVVLSFDSEETFRTVALDRETGEPAWTLEDGSAGQVSDQWALIDNAGTATTWRVLNVEDGSDVAVVDASEDAVPSVQLGTGSMLVAAGGNLEARSLAGTDAGAGEVLWTAPTEIAYAEVTSQLGEMLLIDAETGSVRRIVEDE